MSKYTTQVRFICENKSGLEVSGGSGDVDNIIAGSWNKIFTSKAPFFDEAYRSVLCSKILKHYYMREICCETIGIWILWMNERLETVMPYYNQLYNSELIKFNPLYDVDITINHGKTVDSTEERKGETSDTNNSRKEITNIGTRKVDGTNDTKETVTSDTTTSAESNENKRDLYSDTPQGSITGLENENYLTNARKITDNVSNNGSEDTNTSRNVDNGYTENGTTNNTENMTANDTKIGTNNVTGTSNTTENYLETLIGKQSNSSYSKMLMEFRDTFLNIDMMIINEFKDLFFGLW